MYNLIIPYNTGGLCIYCPYAIGQPTYHCPLQFRQAHILCCRVARVGCDMHVYMVYDRAVIVWYHVTRVSQGNAVP